jgi:hypothetical protein
MGDSNGSPGWEDGGVYNAVVLKVADKESRNKGTPYLEFSFEVTDGEMQGEHITYEMYATKGRKEAVLRELALFGFDAEAPGADWDGLKEGLVGRECSFVIASETYNGQLRFKIDRLRPKSSAAEVGGVLGKIAALFGSVIRKGSAAASADEQAEKDSKVPF